MEQSWEYLWLLWEASKNALAIITVATGFVGGVVGVAFLVFKFLGEKWISHQFEEQLEAYKAQHVRELELLRHRINSIFDRTKRLHDREFEVLPEIWTKLVEARGNADAYLSAFQSYADLDRMNGAELDEFLSETNFSETQKVQIKDAPSKLEAYIKIYERYRYVDVMDTLREADISLRKDGVFVLPLIREDMANMVELIRSAVIEHNANREHDIRPRIKENADRLAIDGEPLFKKIEESVTTRLWESTKVQFDATVGS